MPGGRCHHGLSVRQAVDEPARSTLVQFGEDVIEQDDGGGADLVRDVAMLSQAQRQRDAALLALRSVRPRSQTLKRDLHLVAMRTDRGRAAAQIVGACACQCSSQRRVRPRSHVHQIQKCIGARQPPVGLLGDRCQCAGQIRSAPSHDLAGRGELVIPDIQCVQGIAVGSLACLLQQIVPLSQDPLEVRARRSELAIGAGEHLIEQGSSHRRPASGNGQVSRAEHHGSDDISKVSQGTHTLAVDLRAGSPPCRNLHLHQAAAVLPTDLRAHIGPLRTRPHQRLGSRAPERTGTVQHRRRLEEVGLAVPVRSHHQRPAGINGDLGGSMIPEVLDAQPSNDHDTRTGISRYRNSPRPGVCSTAGFSASRRTSSTVSPPAASRPSIR